MLSTTRLSSHSNIHLGNSSPLVCVIIHLISLFAPWLSHCTAALTSLSFTHSSQPRQRGPALTITPHLNNSQEKNKLHNKPTMTRHFLWRYLTERRRPKLQGKIADIYFSLLTPIQARCGACVTERTRQICGTRARPAGGERPWTKFGAWAL